MFFWSCVCCCLCFVDMYRIVGICGPPGFVVPASMSKFPSRGKNMENNVFLLFVYDCLRFLGIVGPPTHPHPQRQCHSSLPLEKICEEHFYFYFLWFLLSKLKIVLKWLRRVAFVGRDVDLSIYIYIYQYMMKHKY